MNCPRHGAKHIYTRRGVGVQVHRCDRCSWSHEELTEIFKTFKSAPRSRVQLTAKQAAMLAWVVRFIRTHGYAPSISEVAEHYGICRNAAEQQINAIAAKGWLRRIPRIARGIVLP
jgi:DNA-binding MarR family transcriptional regulator